jgi:translation initiation factor 2 beta subunit (eIF-2beta)/eIF-5
MSESFIFTDYIEDLSLCDEIIEWFNSTDKKGSGFISNHTNDLAKISTDSDLRFNKDLSIRYCDQIQNIIKKYIEKYKFCDFYSPWDIIDSINIQHYKPTEGFYKWHCERIGSQQPSASRHLVFMTYLNDVTEDGETEFYYQEVKFQPKKGLTAIWPADWTHTHRGIASMTQDKYIVTGWYNFIR